MKRLNGFNSGCEGGYNIGKDGSGVAYIGRITTADNGVVFGVSMECFEAPTTGETDINLHSATEGTGVEDTAIGDLTESLIIDGGTQALSVRKTGGTIAADQYLYLTGGGTTAGTYDNGRLVITILGYDVAS